MSDMSYCNHEDYRIGCRACWLEARKGCFDHVTDFMLPGTRWEPLEDNDGTVLIWLGDRLVFTAKHMENGTGDSLTIPADLPELLETFANAVVHEYYMLCEAFGELDRRSIALAKMADKVKVWDFAGLVGSTFDWR